MTHPGVTTPGVATRLAAEIAVNHLQIDAAQRAAAVRLDTLAHDLAKTPGVLERMRGRLRRSNDNGGAPRGVYLWGGVGRGKTLLMDLFFASLQGNESIRSKRSHFYHFMRDVHAELRCIEFHAQPLDIVADRLAQRARVICLDELFVADIADAMILGGLFGSLFRRGVVLVVTSNLPPKDLYKDGLQRQRFLPAIDLLTQHVDIIHLDGGVDYRLRQLEQAPTYVTADGPAAVDAMSRRFGALAGGLATGPLTLVIEGRKMQALNAGPGIVWFDFAALCEGPRSQNDYIELAREYHTIVISSIPVFDLSSENAARRFIMLIDELYDRAVKVVVSAAAAPAELYRGERLQFEFERAASRLIEMQTQAYLAGQHRP